MIHGEENGLRRPTKLFFIPDTTCNEDSPRPILAFTGPTDGALLYESPVPIYGIASASKEFKDWILEYGIGDSPSSWPDIAHSETAYDQPEKLLDWDIKDFENGRVVLRLSVRSERGGTASVVLPLNILLPTPTASPTASPSPTPTDTPVPTATNTPSPSLTPTP